MLEGIIYFFAERRKNMNELIFLNESCFPTYLEFSNISWKEGTAVFFFWKAVMCYPLIKHFLTWYHIFLAENVLNCHLFLKPVIVNELYQYTRAVYWLFLVNFSILAYWQ